MEIKTVSFDLAISLNEEKVKLVDFGKILIAKLKEIQDFKESKENKDGFLEIETDSFKILVTPIGIMGRLREKYSIDTLFVELEKLINLFTIVVTEINKEVSCGISIRIVYGGNFSSVFEKIIKKEELNVGEKKISVISALIDLKEKEEECPFNIVVKKDSVKINLAFCVGSASVCEKELCIMPEEIRIAEKVQKTKKIIDGLL